MGKSYTIKRKINGYDCNADYSLSPVSVLKYFQETSAEQSDVLGDGSEQLEQKGCAWILTKTQIVFDSYPKYGQIVSTRTEAVSCSGFIAGRLFEMFDENGSCLAHSKTNWVMLDLKNNEMVRLEKVSAEKIYDTAPDVKPYRISRLRRLKEYDEQRFFDVRYEDIDFNHHVNNVRYFAWAIEMLPFEVYKKQEIASAVIIYKNQGFFGDRVKLWSKSDRNKYRVDIFNQRDELLCQIEMNMRKKIIDKSR